MGFGPNRVRSLPDGVAQALQEYIKNYEQAEKGDEGDISSEGYYSSIKPTEDRSLMKIGDLCPECGQAALVNEEGCRKCYACAYSEC